MKMHYFRLRKFSPVRFPKAFIDRNKSESRTKNCDSFQARLSSARQRSVHGAAFSADKLSGKIQCQHVAGQ